MRPRTHTLGPKSCRPGALLAAAAVLTAALLAPAASLAAASDGEGPWWFPTQGDWVETQALAPGEPREDLPAALRFGAHVAIDGDTLVASTQFDFFDDNWFRCPGLGKPHDYPEFEDGCDWVYVYNRGADGAWVQTAKLVPSDAEPGDTFGWALAVDEESGVIAVGNPGPQRTHPSAPPAAHERTDTVHVFERQPNGSWVPTASLHKTYPGIPDDKGSLFGISVAVSGHTVAATDIVEHDCPCNNTFVFEKVDGEWIETAALQGGGGPQGVALAGDTLVTAKGWHEDSDCGIWTTRPIVVYNRVDGEWVQAAEFEPEEAREKSQTLAARLALSGDGTTIVAGVAVDRRVYGVHTEHCVTADAPAPVGAVEVHTQGGAAGAVGSAWIFELVDGAWVQTADIPNPTPSYDSSSVFGAAVDVSGGVAVIGAYGDLYNGPNDRPGAAYVYEKLGGEWTLRAKLRNHDSGDEADWFGYSVGVSGATVVAGAPMGGGSAHVFEPLGPAAALGALAPEV